MDHSFQNDEDGMIDAPALIDEIIRDKGQVDYKAILTYTQNGQPQVIGHFIDPGEPHCRVWLRFHESDPWKSYLRIRIILREPDKDDDTITLKFGVDCINHDSFRVEDIANSPAELATTPLTDNIVSKGLLRKLTFSYDATTLATEGLWTKYEGDEKLQANLTHLRTELLTGRLALYVRSTDNLVPAVQDIVDRLKTESQQSPLNLWHTAHPNKHFVQLGQVTEAEDRPNISVGAELSFGGVGEYVTVHGYGAIVEHELEAERADAMGTVKFEIRLLEIAGEGDRRYMGVLDVPSGITIEEGDGLAINFNPDTDDREEDWSATVLPTLPSTNIGQVTMIVRRKYNRKDKTFVPTPVISIPIEVANADMRAAVTTGPTNPITVQMITDRQTLKRQIKAIRTFQDDRLDLSTLLCYGRSDLMKPSDIFAKIPQDQLDSRLNRLNLTGTQLTALQYCRSLPGGIRLVQGPPGTGKTHWCTQMVQPFLYKNEKHQVLIVTPTNNTADELVEKIQEVADQLELTKDAIIIRFHTLTSEKDVVWKNAKGDRDPGPKIIDMEEGAFEILQQLDAAKYVYDMYQESAYRPSLVDDKRMHLIDHSLGGWILKITGIHPHPLSEPGKWSKFKNWYSTYNEEDLTSEQATQFRACIDEVRHEVLTRASIVVSTVNNSGTPKLQESFHPSVVFMDEAGKITESDALIPLTMFGPVTAILIGDHKQLNPIVKSKSVKGRQQFSSQLGLALFTRFMLARHPSIMSREQHRMVPEIGSMVSRLFYNGQLIHASSTMSRPLSQTMRLFNSSTYGVMQPFVMLDVNSRAATHNTSRYNMINAAVGLDLTEKLLQHFDPKDISIIIPYRAQYEVYRRGLRQMETTKQVDLRAIQLHTIDSMQGREASIVIVDLVVTDKLGFTHELNRLNVAISRARDGLIVITNAAANEKSRGKMSRWVVNVIGEFKHAKAVHFVRKAPVSPYIVNDQLGLSLTTTDNITTTNEDSKDGEGNKGTIQDSQTDVGWGGYSDAAPTDLKWYLEDGGRYQRPC